MTRVLLLCLLGVPFPCFSEERREADLLIVGATESGWAAAIEIEAFNEEKYGAKMPGLPWHGPSTFRPAEAEAIFRYMSRPWIEFGQVEVFWNRFPTGAISESSGPRPRLTALEFSPVGGGETDLTVEAKLTIDASDWGEAIQVAGGGAGYH